jgi:hypothetical protein
MCEVRRNGKTKVVKNLSWLLRHWRSTRSFEVGIAADGYTLTAFGDDWVFTTPYASLSVLHDWLNRPVFVGLPVAWLVADKVKIGSLEYTKLAAV